MKIIPLTQGRECLVDEDDFERLSAFKWHAYRNGKYWQAIRRVYPKPCPAGTRGKVIWMARFIINAPEGVLVDHIDGNTLNNQKSNLRFADRVQNGCNSGLSKSNTSGLKGVSRNHSGKWIAQISFKGTFHWIGSFISKNEAAKAYDEAALLLHGEFARTNQQLNLI